MEVQSNTEQRIQVVTQADLMSGFRTYRNSLVQDGVPNLDRLAAYGRFAHTFASYFKQPNIVEKEARDAAERLFYNPQRYPEMESGFSEEVSDSLKKDIFVKDGRQTKRVSWARELAVIRNYTQRELQEITLAYNYEAAEVASLRALAEPINPIVEEVVEGELQPQRMREALIKERAVQTVAADDPELSLQLSQRQRFVDSLERIIDTRGYSQDVLREALSQDGFSRYLTKTDGESWMEELDLRATFGENTRIGEILTELKESVSNPDYFWRQWVANGTITQDFLTRFEDIMVLAEVEEVAGKLEGFSVSARARALLPYLKQGVSAGLLKAVATGEFVFPDTYASDQIDSFLHFSDEYQMAEKKHEPWSLKRKLVTAATITALVATPLVHNHVNHSPDDPQKKKERIERTLQEQPKVEKDRVIRAAAPQEELEDSSLQPEGEQGRGGSGTGGSGQGAGERPPSSRVEGPEFSSSVGNTEFFKPDNTSPEDFEAASKTKVWSVEGFGKGVEVTGLYRGSTASKFDEKQHGWVASKTRSSDQSVTRNVESQIKMFHPTEQRVKISKKLVEIPVKGGHAIWAGKINVTDSQNRSLPKIVTKARDGTYFVEFNDADLGKEVRLDYYTGEAPNTIPAPNRAELAEMKRQVLDVNTLPDEVKSVLQEVNKKNLTPTQKAFMLEKYIKDNYIYSLEPKWSDYYHEAEDAQEFFRRIVEIKRCDCDVANTALALLLRTQNIPSRMVFGYANDNTLEGKEKYLSAVEGHGWVESYIDGNWVMFDATPGAIDDERTRLALINAGGTRAENMIDKRSTLEKLTDSLRDVVTNPYIDAAILIEAASLYLFFKGRSNTKKDIEYVEKLKKEVRMRAEQYTGGQYPEVAAMVSKRESTYIDSLKPTTSNPLFAITGVVPAVDFVKEMLKRNKLDQYPVEPSGEVVEGEEVWQPAIKPSPEPNLREFEAGLLGVSLKKIDQRMYIQAFQSSLRLASTMQAQTMEDLCSVEGNYLTDRFYKNVSRAVKYLRKPQSASDWQQQLDRIKGTLYPKYEQAYGYRVKKLNEQFGEAAEDDITMKNREEFSDSIDALASYRLLKWELGEQYSQIRSHMEHLNGDEHDLQEVDDSVGED